MRHSTIDLTMNVYTDPKLLDVAGAVESLPSLPLSGQRCAEWGSCCWPSGDGDGKCDRRKH